MTKLQVMTLLALSAGVIGVGNTEAHAKVCPDGSVVPIYESCPRKIKAPRPIPRQASTADAFASGAPSRAPEHRSQTVRRSAGGRIARWATSRQFVRRNSLYAGRSKQARSLLHGFASR